MDSRRETAWSARPSPSCVSLVSAWPQTVALFMDRNKPCEISHLWERRKTKRLKCLCCWLIPRAALKNPEVVAKRGGLSTILKSVIDCQLSRINEALITTILHLLNHPRTRQYVRVDVELEVCTDMKFRVINEPVCCRISSFRLYVSFPWSLE